MKHNWYLTLYRYTCYMLTQQEVCETFVDTLWIHQNETDIFPLHIRYNLPNKICFNESFEIVYKLFHVAYLALHFRWKPVCWASVELRRHCQQQEQNKFRNRLSRTERKTSVKFGSFVFFSYFSLCISRTSPCLPRNQWEHALNAGHAPFPISWPWLISKTPYMALKYQIPL